MPFVSPTVRAGLRIICRLVENDVPAFPARIRSPACRLHRPPRYGLFPTFLVRIRHQCGLLVRDFYPRSLG